MGQDEEERPPKPHSESLFKQQKMTSYFPQHSAQTLTIALLIAAVVFVPIGAVIVVSSDAVFEMDVRYDQVNAYKYPGSQTYSFLFNSTTVTAGSNCKRLITLTKAVSAPVYIYYKLVNYHQNYRQYQISRDDAQFLGGTTDPISDCSPYRTPGEINSQTSTLADGKPYGSYFYSPCGSIAWSMFNDTISLYKVTSSTPAINTSDPTLPTGNIQKVCVGGNFTADGTNKDPSANLCSKSGIALSVDRESRFKAPSASLTNVWTSAGVPSSNDPFLAAGYYASEAGHKLPTTTDEDFMVWSRTASLPTFWKLYRVINTDLVAGDYLLDIEEHFDVTSFEGEKHVVLATRTWIGGKNYVLGISLIVMGGLSFILAIAVVTLTYVSTPL